MVHIDRMKPFIDRTITPPCDEEIQEIIHNNDDVDELAEEDKVQFDQPENNDGSDDKICTENYPDAEGKYLDASHDQILNDLRNPTSTKINQGYVVVDMFK